MNQLEARIIMRNDSLADWEINKNVILSRGEFGVAFDSDGKANVKVGDGFKTWEELDWLSGDSASVEGITQEQLDELKATVNELSNRFVVNKPTSDDFPRIGDAEAIYKAEKEGKLYQWNTEKHDYEPLTADVSEKITIIHGGDAYGTA